ncbi:MAG: hypothetical protein QW776_01495 [Candidatus Nitrosocaldus sp.]
MGINYAIIATAIATAVVLALILVLISITYKSDDITLSDLYRVDAHASIAVLDRLDGDEQCIVAGAGDEFMNISKALRDEIMNVRYWADTAGMYNEYSGVTISGAEAYELITVMMKQATLAITKPHIDMLYKMRDEHGYISCIIEYDGRYYHIRINPFASILNDGYGYGYHSIPEDQGYVTVRITYKELDDARFKIVALDSNEHEVFAPFNNILLFINELDSKLTIYAYTEGQIREDLSHKHASIIPPKGSRLVIFPGLMESKYSYTVKPYNMEGIVNVRSYPSCMSADEARHGYALANFDLKLPSYLPDGYEYRCALHILNNYVMIYYSKDVDAGPATSMQEALAKGVLVMTAYRVLPSEEDYWNASRDVKSANGSDAIMVDIDGNQAVAYKDVDVDYDRWEKYYYNILNLYDDESRVIYSFKSRSLTVDDLVDIARSLG